ncbi:cortactin-binding 2 protein, partial [Mytilus galloprovincialis]
LYIASKEGHNGLIQTLLNARANVNMPCEKGEQHTPLIAATAAEQFDVIKLLLKNNCDINAPDKDGWTPLWHAYGNNDEDSMKLLLKSGADKNIRNADGVTIMDEARDADDDSMIELLQSMDMK